jgi:hypothetical protein
VVRADLEARARDLESFFATLLRDAAEAAKVALERSPSSVILERRSERLASRLEGAAVLDSGGTYLDWNGTPSDPGPPGAGGAISAWSIRKQGFWTRLVTATAPGAGGRIGSASFLLDSPRTVFSRSFRPP